MKKTLSIFCFLLVFSAIAFAQTQDNKETDKSEKGESAKENEEFAAIITVEVLIDEKGFVIKAKAKNGDKKFRKAAEQAAKNAKFSPTIIDGVAYRVTGIMTYKFSKKEKPILEKK